MEYEVDFKQTIEEAFLKYGANIAQDRALPDVRDFMKPGLRQGLYAQFSNKITHKDKFQKAQKSVAAAMAQSYVHGDAAMYDTFIRTARPWSYRYPIEEVQGNYGNPTSPDSHAAARYVEMRAGEIANCFFEGLKKNAIGEQWYNNYDDTELIPSVFPSIGFWNIVNGCNGIAVAMTTSVPQFNLKEVNEALIKIIQNPNIDFNEIYCAPDFATGSTIINAKEVKESLKNGNGSSIRLRAKLEYFPDQNMIQATELPYGVFTNTVIDQLANLTNENPAYGIEKITDHTKKNADIRIYLSKGINPKRMIEKLYKDTSLENWFAVNMIMLDNGRFPKVFGWREACDAYISHIKECERNIIQFDLDKALARQNIVEGLIIAAASIDEVVAIIRASKDPSEASIKLIERFNFNEDQTKAILAMKLSALTKVDAIKLNNELAELRIKIEEYRHLLSDSTALNNELIKVLQAIADKYGDNRRTKVLNIIEKEENDINQLQEEEVNIMLFDNNMIRLVKKEDMQGGKRGRKGVNIKAPKGANLINTLYGTNLSTIMAFSNKGKMYNFSLSDLDIGKDYSIYELIQLANDEKILMLIDSSSFNAYKYLVTVSKKGYIKKSNITEYNFRQKRGVVAVKLEENDSIINVFLSSSNEDRIFIIGSGGNYNFYPISEISSTGRATKGVKAIKLDENEFIQTATIVKSNIKYKGIFTVSSSGKGKITKIEEFPETSRAVKGPQAMSLKEDRISAAYACPVEKDNIYVVAGNHANLISLDDFSTQGRMTSGVKIIDVKNKIDIEII